MVTTCKGRPPTPAELMILIDACGTSNITVGQESTDKENANANASASTVVSCKTDVQDRSKAMRWKCWIFAK